MMHIMKAVMATGGLYWEVPVGAEAYDADGNLVVAKNVTGKISGPAGQIVFKDVGSYQVKTSCKECEVLVVAGGGGGGSSWVGGGGGGGGVIHEVNFAITASDVRVTVGDGGAVAQAGGDSNFASLVAIGGATQGKNGGSGGGGSPGGSGGSALQPTSAAGGMGNKGGNGSSSQSGGGGGGAISAGSSGDEGSRRGGNGGQGYVFAGQIYGSGGAGCGDYSCGTSGPNAGNGQPHFGGGGRGKNKGGNPLPGGSGIVIVRWGGYSHNYDPSA